MDLGRSRCMQTRWLPDDYAGDKYDNNDDDNDDDDNDNDNDNDEDDNCDFRSSNRDLQSVVSCIVPHSPLTVSVSSIDTSDVLFSNDLLTIVY